MLLVPPEPEPELVDVEVELELDEDELELEDVELELDVDELSRPGSEISPLPPQAERTNAINGTKNLLPEHILTTPRQRITVDFSHYTRQIKLPQRP